MEHIPPSIPATELAVLARRGGLVLTEAQLAGLHEVYGHFEAMLERLRAPFGPERARGAEPAHVFVPGQEWAKAAGK